PRKASLQVAHQKDCRHATRTALNSVRGCSCSPSFYVFHRDEDGRPVKGARLKDRAVADTALRRVQVELDENRAGVRREQNITFDEWADRYEAIIEGRIADGDLHPRTLTSYRSTLDRARKVFGSLHLREIGAPELRDFSEAP